MTAEEEAPPAPAVPDYLASPNAVFDDEGVQWRYGKPPDYSKTRKVWEEGKKSNHEAGSLPQLVENLVKNWEVEASFKPRLSDWRTIDHDNYQFAMNGGPPQSAEHMLKCGTYNAIICPNEYYDPNYSDFASSHKTFKRMMPTFAWEVLEVYSGPPKVTFKWRHWGTMKNDYVGFNNKGEKVTAKAHGGPIEVFGVTVATVDDKVRLQYVDTWMDPLDMFRQIAPHGVVNKQPMDTKVSPGEAMDVLMDHDGLKIAEEHNNQAEETYQAPASTGAEEKHISNETGEPADRFVPFQGACPFAATAQADGLENPHHNPSNTFELPLNGESSQGQAAVKISPQQQNRSTGHISVSRGSQMDVDQAVSATTATGAHDSAPDSETQAEQSTGAKHPLEDPERSIYSSAVTGDVEDVIKIAKRDDYVDESRATGTHDVVDQHLEQAADVVHPHPKDIEQAVQPEAGEAVAAPAGSDETVKTMQEMSNISAEETKLIMNKE